nr:hypothetical protein CFP56_78911 [Quercus suber]
MADEFPKDGRQTLPGISTRRLASCLYDTTMQYPVKSASFRNFRMAYVQDPAHSEDHSLEYYLPCDKRCVHQELSSKKTKVCGKTTPSITRIVDYHCHQSTYAAATTGVYFNCYILRSMRRRHAINYRGNVVFRPLKMCASLNCPNTENPTVMSRRSIITQHHVSRISTSRSQPGSHATGIYTRSIDSHHFLRLS